MASLIDVGLDWGTDWDTPLEEWYFGAKVSIETMEICGEWKLKDICSMNMTV